MKNTLIDNNLVVSGDFGIRSFNGPDINQSLKLASRMFRHVESSEVVISSNDKTRQFLPIFREEELIDQNLSIQDNLEMKFPGKHLVRYIAFAKHRRQIAINLCQQDITAGIFCVLMESDTYFTVWREQSSESQKVSIETTPALQTQLNESQLSRTQRKRISSQIEEFESIHAASPNISAVNNLADDSASQTLEITVEPIDASSQSATLQHKPALAAANTKTSTSREKTTKTPPTPRSIFLTQLNQELTKHIGPSADYLINELLAKRPSIRPEQMINAIVAEISDPKTAKDIQKSLERLTHKFAETM